MDNEIQRLLKKKKQLSRKLKTYKENSPIIKAGGTTWKYRQIKSDYENVLTKLAYMSRDIDENNAASENKSVSTTDMRES